MILYYNLNKSIKFKIMVISSTVRIDVTNIPLHHYKDVFYKTV